MGHPHNILTPQAAREALERLERHFDLQLVDKAAREACQLLRAFIDQVESRVDKDDVFVLRRILRVGGDFAQKSAERCEALHARGLLARESRVYATKKGGKIIERQWFYTVTDRGLEAMRAFESRVAA